jgi:cyanophycinase
VTGRLALHGGGEFLSGDEPFLDALLAASRRAADDASRPLRIVVVPTAAARGRPDLAAANGVEALRRRALENGIDVEAGVARVVDAASAADPALAAAIGDADLVYLPGGDPDLIPAILGGSAAAAALRAAYDRGAVLAGASAGAMGLAAWTWTPDGGVPGLGYVPGIAVVPHFDENRALAGQSAREGVAPGGLGYLGLDERTGVISDDGEWLVAGEGAAHWFAPGATDPVVARHGERMRIGPAGS